MARFLPKTLAKTISYIGYQAPGEYGLFWNADGTMPWKELYWALQDDPELRFVREKHIQELHYLGLDLPFSLDGHRLQLKEKVQVPSYPAVVPPARLYYACPRKSYVHTREKGLNASHREFLPLVGSRDFAESLARRRDPKPILLEIQARKAHEQGIAFRLAGPDLYLTETVRTEFLIFPLISEERLSAMIRSKKKETHGAIPTPFPSPGSFVLGTRQFEVAFSPELMSGKDKKRTSKGQDWKRGARKVRDKRVP